MRSVTNVWNFTTSAPTSAAASTRSRARPTSPSWLTPASAMTRHGAPAPTTRPPMATVALTIGGAARPSRRHDGPDGGDDLVLGGDVEVGVQGQAQHLGGQRLRDRGT